MRGTFLDQGGLFSYISPEARVPTSHPLRKIRELVRDVLGELNRTLGRLYASEGRPSIPPELRRQKDKKALLPQSFSGLLVRKKSGYYPIEHTDRSISHLHEFGEESQFLTDNRRGCPTFC